MTDPQAWPGSPRSTAVAWGLGGGCVMGFGGSVLLAYQTEAPEIFSNVVRGILLVVLFAALGTLLALRQPANPIGWLLTAGAAVWLTILLTGDLVDESLESQAEVPLLVNFLALYETSIWPLGLLCSVGLPLLLFPSGHTRSQRWRWVRRAMFSAGLLAMIALVLSDAPIDDDFGATRGLSNPWGVERLSTLTAVFSELGPALLLVTMAAAVGGILFRLKAASGVERQQLRWVITGALVAISGILVFPLGKLLDLSAPVVEITSTVTLSCVPLSLTVAILRYRLYDLDRIISRTVTYAVITGLLISTYFGLVAAVSQLTPSGSSLAVAGSTLAVAALFQPLRGRVQQSVDRRFNRARYDADRTIESFTRRLRDEVDLDNVRSDLLHVVGDALQPSTVNLWLRKTGR